MSQQYEIVVTNNSANQGTFCCYQQDPGIYNPQVFSLAWMTQQAMPNMRASFRWALDYCFVWGQTGQLMPGVSFNASQTNQVDLNNSNMITLDYRGGFQFANQMRGPQPGTLTITQTPSIPNSLGAVGIGMSGAGTFVAQAMPNMNLPFTPRPEYYVAFGRFNTGDVLNVGSINNMARVDFPGGVYTMYATLNPNNTWTVSPNQS